MIPQSCILQATEYSVLDDQKPAMLGAMLEQLCTCSNSLSVRLLLVEVSSMGKHPHMVIRGFHVYPPDQGPPKRQQLTENHNINLAPYLTCWIQYSHKLCYEQGVSEMCIWCCKSVHPQIQLGQVATSHCRTHKHKKNEPGCTMGNEPY